MNGLQIWSLAIHPKNPDTVYAGTCPSALFRSDDGGETWKQLSVELVEDCGAIIPRVTTIITDPTDDQTVYAGIEIDGMRISRDGGETWTSGNEGLSSLDIHGLALVPGSPKTLVAGTNNDVCITTDMMNWTRLNVKASGSLALLQGGALYVRWSGVCRRGEWDRQGDEGGLFYTSDLGQSWARADLNGNTNSTVWAIVHNPDVPNLMIAYSIAGQIFSSSDNGDSWTKIAREFGEVRAVAIAP